MTDMMVNAAGEVWPRIYFMVFYVIVQWIILNIVVAMMLDVFTSVEKELDCEVDRLSNIKKLQAKKAKLGDEDQFKHFCNRVNEKILKEEVEKKIVVCSASSEQGELGAQMIVDMFESNGWQVRFLGGSVSIDDVLAFTQEYHPDILLVYGMNANRAPEIRTLIDKIREIGAWPDMQIMLSGGVFDRAEGLWEEIGADLYASNPAQAIQIASTSKDEQPKPRRTINRRKRRSAESIPVKELATETSV